MRGVLAIGLLGGDSGDVDHPKPVQADQGIPVFVDHPYRLMLTR